MFTTQIRQFRKNFPKIFNLVLTILLILILLATLIPALIPSGLPASHQSSFTLNEESSSTDLALMAGGRFSVDATDEAGNNIKVSTQGTDAGCHYEGSINGIAFPSFDDPNPCSGKRFWAWWASHALKTVEDTVGPGVRRAIEAFLRRFIY